MQWEWEQGPGWLTGPDSALCSQHPISGREVLEAEQDSLHLCLLGLSLWLQDLERGLGPCVSAQSRMVQLQVGKGLRMGASFPWKWISSMFPMSGWEEGGGSNSSPRSVVFWCLCVCVCV